MKPLVANDTSSKSHKFLLLSFGSTQKLYRLDRVHVQAYQQWHEDPEVEMEELTASEVCGRLINGKH